MSGIASTLPSTNTPKKLFATAVERQGPSFRREVAAFRVLNRIPNAIGPRIPTRWRHQVRAVLPR